MERPIWSAASGPSFSFTVPCTSFSSEPATPLRLRPVHPELLRELSDEVHPMLLPCGVCVWRTRF